MAQSSGEFLIEVLESWRLKALGVVELLGNALHSLIERLPWAAGRQHNTFSLLGGQVAIVTGGNAGIGFATAAELVRRGCDVILACRSRERAEAAAACLRGLEPMPEALRLGSVEVAALDLASFDSVRSFARRFNASGRALDLLLCNAGVMAPPDRLETADGFEMQFQVNYLAHWLLAHELLSAQVELQRRAPRIVFLSSMTHHGGRLRLDGDFQVQRRYCPLNQYSDTKLANIFCAKEFHRCLAARGRQEAGSAVACHPGIVDTALARQYFTTEVPRPVRWLILPILERLFFPLFLRTPTAAAETVLFACTAPTAEVGGQYVAGGHVARSSPESSDPLLASRLWELSCRLTGIAIDGAF